VKNLTSKGFDLLLASLDADSGVAAQKYQALRQKLMFKFMREDRGRWNADYEYLTDDTIERTAQYLESGKVIEKSLSVLALGIARIVWLNFIKKHKISVEIDSIPEPSYNPENGEEEINQAISCLRSCLIEVCKNDDERTVILRYYRQADSKLLEQRKKLAEELNISTNTLKTQMCRLRDKLRKCVNECLKKREKL
jgi:DNA-directed RNA polymerase specialized sigma24 family protein